MNLDDDMVLTRIMQGHVTFRALRSLLGWKFRRVDRALQRLRKRGIIRFDRTPGLKTRWVVEEFQPRPGEGRQDANPAEPQRG